MNQLDLSKGGPVIVPSTGDQGYFVDTDGVLKQITAAGTVTPFVVAAPGPNLTGAASQTINPASDAASLYSLPTPLTQNATLVLGVSGSPITDAVVTVWKVGGGAFTYTVNDDASTPLFTFASNSTKQAANFYFDGTHYVFLSFVYTA